MLFLLKNFAKKYYVILQEYIIVLYRTFYNIKFEGNEWINW